MAESPAVTTSFTGQSASENARQHNGNVLNQSTYNYTTQQLVADGGLASSRLGEALLDAAANGQTIRVRYLLDRGADIDHADEDGMTALHHACLSAFEDTLEYLLDSHANVNAVSAKCGTPLCIAVAKESSSVVQALLDRRANVEAPGGCFGSALHVACSKDTEDGEKIAKMFLERNPRLDMRRVVEKQKWREFSIGFSARVFDQQLELVQESDLKKVSDPARDMLAKVECEVLFLAAASGSLRTVEELLSRDAAVNAIALSSNDSDRNLVTISLTAYLIATGRENAEIPILLLSHGADADFVGELGGSSGVRCISALHAAALNQKPKTAECIRLAIQQGVSIEAHSGARCGTPLLFACRLGNLAVAQHLLDLGADIHASDTKANSALHKAARSGNVKLIELLISHGADVNQVGGNNYTPLLVSIAWDLHLATAALLSHGANIHYRHEFVGSDNKPYWDTMLHRACTEGSRNAARILIEHGFDVNAVDSQSYAPLHTAVDAGDINMTKLLLESGADFNKTYKGHYTALHIAAHHGNVEILELLLECGADPSLRGRYNDTAWERAAMKGHKKAASILEARMSSFQYTVAVMNKLFWLN